MSYESTADILAAVQAALGTADAATPSPAPAPPAKPEPARKAAPAREFWTIPGLCWNARVTTSFGDLPVQGLRARDPVRTPGGSFAQIAHVDEIKLDEDFLAGFPDAQPITIQPGALGNDKPRTAITVSPHQRIGVGDTRYSAEMRMARDLLGRPGVLRAPEPMVRYFIFHCGQPTSVLVEGVWLATSP